MLTTSGTNSEESAQSWNFFFERSPYKACNVPIVGTNYKSLLGLLQDRPKGSSFALENFSLVVEVPHWMLKSTRVPLSTSGCQDGPTHASQPPGGACVI